MPDERYVAVKPTALIVDLFDKIGSMEGFQEQDRQSVFNRVLLRVCEMPNEKLVIASKTKIGVEEEMDLPSSLKVRTNCELLNAANNKFREVFNIERVKASFLMRVSLMAYYLYLIENNRELGIVGETNDKYIQENMSDVESINSYTSMLMNKEKNEQYINRIKNIIAEWKEFDLAEMDTNIKIGALNVNQLLGLNKWNELSEKDKVNISKKNIDKLLSYIENYFTSDNDLLVLQEVPYKLKEIYDELIGRIETEWKVLTPKELKRPHFITCAVVKSKDKEIWSNNEEIQYGKENYLNRVINLKYEKSGKEFYVLGIHIPWDNDAWNDVIKYYEKVKDKDCIIIGDFNVYDEENRYRKRLDELLQGKEGAKDIWKENREKGAPENCPTITIHGADGNRIDYVLATNSIWEWIKQGTIEIDSNPRKEDGFTDHSAIILKLNL